MNTKTKEIIALEVIDEGVHDGKVMDKLLKHALKSNDKGPAAKVKSVLDDGAYDSNESFKCLEENKIQPGIKVRGNSIISAKNAVAEIGKSDHKKIFPDGRRKENTGNGGLLRQHFLP